MYGSDPRTCPECGIATGHMINCMRGMEKIIPVQLATSKACSCKPCPAEAHHCTIPGVRCNCVRCPGSASGPHRDIAPCPACHEEGTVILEYRPRGLK